MTFKRVGTGSQTHALCINMSAYGILFEAEMDVQIGRALEIRTFPSDRMTPPITALVQVERCTPAPSEGRYRIACIIKGIKSQTPEPGQP